MSRPTRDGMAEPVSRDKFSGAIGDKEKSILPVQLTTIRIGNHSESADHTYILLVTKLLTFKNSLLL